MYSQYARYEKKPEKYYTFITDKHRIGTSPQVELSRLISLVLWSCTYITLGVINVCEI